MLKQPVKLWADARLIEIQGATAAEFLQGYLTCDTAALDVGQARPMAICTVKGRVLASGWALGLADGIGLLVHKSLAARVQTFLLPYIRFSKCTLNDQPSWILLSEDDGAYQLLPQLSVLPASIEPSGAEDCSSEVDTALVDAQFAFVSEPVSEQFLPQMLALDARGAVDFDKGCYLGQEIVARAQFRGAVKRGLSEFSFAAPAPATGQDWQGQGTVIATAAGGRGLLLGKLAS